MAACIGTWPFSLAAVEAAKGKLLHDETAVQAVEYAISLVEDDIETGQYFVGRGGAPNMSGVLQCDAAIMNGLDLSFGAVAALEGIATPIRVASRVMTKSDHSFLVGAGAKQFAIDECFSIEPPERLLPKAAVATSLPHTKIVECEDNSSNFNHPHDTIGLIALDRLQNIAAGVSTSGLANKFPGRVGDSPIPGCGLYADINRWYFKSISKRPGHSRNQRVRNGEAELWRICQFKLDSLAGAACATGDGDEIMKFCPSVRTVDLMRHGAEPYDACRQVVSEIRSRIGDRKMFEIGIIAMDMKGRYGAAGSVKAYQSSTFYPGFPFCVWTEGHKAPQILFAEPSTL